MLDQQELDTRFTYHRPHGDQQSRYELIRSLQKQFADTVNRLCPASRETALAITKIEEAGFWANASIARREDEAPLETDPVDPPPTGGV